jgi:Fur family ferric uptake transcriptional regulator
MQKRALAVEKTLSESGYRVTRPRQAVIEVVTRARRSLSPEEVLSRARKIDPDVGLATVYRTLDMLQSLGQLRRVRIGKKGYALNCTESKLHFHLVCEKCRAVTELATDRSTHALANRLQATGFKSQANAIEIVGLCAKCSPNN